MDSDKKIRMSLTAFMIHFIFKQKWAFLVLLPAPLALVIEANVLPYAVKLMIDNIISYTGDRQEVFAVLKYPITLFLGGWVIMVTVFRIQEWVYNTAIPKFQANVRTYMFDYIKGHSHRYFANNFAGSLANRVSDMTRGTSDLLEYIRWRVIGPSAILIVTIIMTWRVSWVFSLIIFLWFIVNMVMGWLYSIRINCFSEIHSEDRTTLSGKIVDVFTNITNMKLFARDRYEEDYIGKFQEVERKSNVKTQVEIWKTRLLMEPTTLTMFIVLMWFLIKGWQEGYVTPGDFVFIVYAALSVLWNVWLLLTELPMFFSNMGVCNQALSVIKPEHEIKDKEGAKELKVTKGEIVFDGVNFHYHQGRNIFKDKNIEIKAGQKVGLVGFSGSGKSTFVNLILRFYDIDSGRILIDGQNIAEVTQHSLRNNISMIPQDTSLFHRTLMENIRYGRPDATDDEVIAASKKAHCHEFIKEIKEGYDALVGERGVKLSGGQRQRIAIARAILKNAPILILDEATSSLDSVTEKYIQESLTELMKGKTTIVVAHRLSTLSGMDRIIVFNEGQIIEDGTHGELLKSKGHYAKLWDMQAGGFLPEL